MTRIQEPDLLIDHDSGGGGGCQRFLGGPVEPFTYSGVTHMKLPGHVQKSSVGSKWFPFTYTSSCRAKNAEAVSLSSSSSSSATEEKPIIVVHNNNNNVILDVMDENTRWSSSTEYTPSCKTTSTILPPILPHSNGSSTGNKTKSRNSSTSHNLSNSSSNNSNSKSKHKNNMNNSNNVSNKNNCSPSSINKSSENRRISNNCGPASVTTTASSHINSNSRTLNHSSSSEDEEESGGRHLIIRYIQCNERPSKKQLVTLGLVSVVFLIVLVTLLALFLSPTSTRTLGNSSRSSGSGKDEISDAFISSDISSSLNNDDVELDDSDSYDDSDSSYYSSTSSSNINTGIDLKKVSKLSWDLLNSNQDASARGGSGSSSGTRGVSLPPLGGGGGDGEIILPAKMIYTSSGDSTDLMPSENGGVSIVGGGGSQNKKRSCCRTQKYSQIIKREGCEPMTIVNKMCFGQCVSVWVPGLFASFPVCRPSKSTFKMVTLTCGRNKEKRKRVRIEKVRRCSCMEIEPTAASL
ncbi:unnamed protein product [Orchesella dallaii]|uniref:CTCK domain-containing protein n=1 Tax=Orchesella dallaii TaxID=48710 RepID=A0ABP1Q960_9HEXA